MLGGLLLSCPSGHGLVTVLGTWLDRLSARSPSSLPGQARAWDAPPGGSALGLGPSHWEAGHPRTGWLGRGHCVTPSSPRSVCPGPARSANWGGRATSRAQSVRQGHGGPSSAAVGTLGLRVGDVAAAG